MFFSSIALIWETDKMKYRIIRNGEIVGDKVNRGTVLEEREYETTKKGDR